MTSDLQDGDFFDSILNLEDQYFAEGYALGVADGGHLGKVEGRVFGHEKGYEKFLQMSKLGGRAAVWSARLPSTLSKLAGKENTIKTPPLKASERLKRHVERLSSLTDPDDLSTENSEEAVSEVDGRLKESTAKAMLIAKMTGEGDGIIDASRDLSISDNAPSSSLKVRRDGDLNANKGKIREMEDFTGLPQRSN